MFYYVKKVDITKGKIICDLNTAKLPINIVSKNGVIKINAKAKIGTIDFFLLSFINFIEHSIKIKHEIKYE